MTTLKKILQTLISLPSITPLDAGCQKYMMTFLQELGFTCLPLNNPPVSNFYASLGNCPPILLFAGHTDVVPIGDSAKWNTDPFRLHEENGLWYGRGTADMKGSLASMLMSVSRFINDYPSFNGTLAFLITSGEEGDEYDKGTPYVMEHLQQQGIIPNYCILGEPSSQERVGDMMKIGRRGSLNAHLTLHGKQGHVAYPHLADNPIHRIMPALTELASIRWDEGNSYFPPTSLQMTHVQSGGQACNIIPGEFRLGFNFRYSTEHTAESLQEAVESCFRRHDLNPQIEWRISGQPFLTTKGTLVEHCLRAISQHTGLQTELSTSGGTSDGRFIAPYGVEVVELGPVNTTIHQVNECVAITDCMTLSDIYYTLCCTLLTEHSALNS